MNIRTTILVRALLISGLVNLFFSSPLMANQPDPFASNNTLYPDPKDWAGTFRTSNYAYPTTLVKAERLTGVPTGRITKKNARDYVAAVKKHLEKDISGLVNDPMKWTPQHVGWYDMPWAGQGSTMNNGHVDPTSGREALLGSYTGQILQPKSYPSNPPAQSFQNHAVVYYNKVAGYQLGKIWKNPYEPDLSAAQFPEGSIVVKVETVTLTEEQWSVLKGSSISYIYRPLVASLENELDPTKRSAIITPTRFLQMAVRVKDSIASPVTGWVFIAFAYVSDSKGVTVWERTIPVGATWGNDPDQAKFSSGVNPDVGLQETWINDGLPEFIMDGLGWGGRLAGPLDLGVRHNVVTVSGKRYGDSNPTNPPALASSACFSCHGAAQYPYAANLYPSPNMAFPDEGKKFLLFDPGTPLWAQWFQNRSGNEALSGRDRSGIIATDYDMMLTFALMRANGSADTDAFIRHFRAGH